MKQRWEDWINLVLGAWVFFSPWILGYASVQGAAWNAWVMGIALVVFTLIALSAPEVWEEWLDSAIGLWLVVSPWLLGFYGHAAPTWNAIVLGAVVLAISLEASRPSRQIGTTT